MRSSNKKLSSRHGLQPQDLFFTHQALVKDFAHHSDPWAYGTAIQVQGSWFLPERGSSGGLCTSKWVLWPGSELQWLTTKGL